jgi:hypothetical protein
VEASKTIYIQFEAWEDFKERARKALKGAKPAIAKWNTLTFRSTAEYQKFMIEQKFAILAAIH